MKAQKYSFKDKEYREYQLPNGATTLAELDDVIACAECGKKLTFGSSYTSRTIHTKIGMGYSVCNSCYESEIKIERAFKERW